MHWRKWGVNILETAMWKKTRCKRDLQVSTPHGMDGAIGQEGKGSEDWEAELSYPAAWRESAKLIDNRRRAYRLTKVVETATKAYGQASMPFWTVQVPANSHLLDDGEQNHFLVTPIPNCFNVVTQKCSWSQCSQFVVWLLYRKSLGSWTARGRGWGTQQPVKLIPGISNHMLSWSMWNKRQPRYHRLTGLEGGPACSLPSLTAL